MHQSTTAAIVRVDEQFYTLRTRPRSRMESELNIFFVLPQTQHCGGCMIGAVFFVMRTDYGKCAIIACSRNTLRSITLRSIITHSCG